MWSVLSLTSVFFGKGGKDFLPFHNNNNKKKKNQHPYFPSQAGKYHSVNRQILG